jgi:hypothetical protein
MLTQNKMILTNFYSIINALFGAYMFEIVWCNDYFEMGSKCILDGGINHSKLN